MSFLGGGCKKKIQKKGGLGIILCPAEYNNMDIYGYTYIWIYMDIYGYVCV